MKKKDLAGILAMIFGGLGVHQFYLKRPVLGVLHLIFFWTPVSWIVGWISAVMIFSSSKEKFDRKYNKEYLEREVYNDGKRRREYRYDRRFSRREERYERRTRNRRRSFDQRKGVPYAEPRKKKENPFKQSGIQKYKDYDYDGAIADFEKALELEPKNVAIHFNLACAHSLNENVEKSFYHLDRSVALGLKDTDKIKEHDALAYLRIQTAYKDFENNGYRLRPTQKVVEDKKEDLLNTTPDLLDQLKKLGELKEKGLLTEEEFQSQKKRLLQ